MRVGLVEVKHHLSRKRQCLLRPEVQRYANVTIIRCILFSVYFWKY